MFDRTLREMFPDDRHVAELGDLAGVPFNELTPEEYERIGSVLEVSTAEMNAKLADAKAELERLQRS